METARAFYELQDSLVDDQKGSRILLQPEMKNLNPVRNILNLSFDCLPRHLKNCFLSCSMFPENHLLKRKLLIRLWIAEGFAVERGSSTAEEVAEGYLMELIRQSMLQVEEKNHFGRVMYCRMHNLVRELAVSLSERRSFTVFIRITGGKGWSMLMPVACLFSNAAMILDSTLIYHGYDLYSI
uniref:Disease resistance protein winged helix domain-containing protein n=1 Tax=Ananas comosus var. bracteatus TaxID=296719 RepID=A0A6V7QC14_ANACO|nr:unnamed protein product [Ananas comosus var. bracteatus]